MGIKYSSLSDISDILVKSIIFILTKYYNKSHNFYISYI